ncbi:MAG: hypothetical protein Kow0042_14090 [Calditrichia bacterium]
MEKLKKQTILFKDTLTISSSQTELEKIEQFSQRISKKALLSQEQSDNLAIVLTELVNNAIVHGNKGDVSKKVFLTAKIYQNKVQISIRDQGNSFDPSRLKDPTDPENLWKETGRGLFIVKNLIDDIEFIPHEDGMEIVVTEYVEHLA